MLINIKYIIITFCCLFLTACQFDSDDILKQTYPTYSFLNGELVLNFCEHIEYSRFNYKRQHVSYYRKKCKSHLYSYSISELTKNSSSIYPKKKTINLEHLDILERKTKKFFIPISSSEGIKYISNPLVLDYNKRMWLEKSPSYIVNSNSTKKIYFPLAEGFKYDFDAKKNNKNFINTDYIISQNNKNILTVSEEEYKYKRFDINFNFIKDFNFKGLEKIIKEKSVIKNIIYLNKNQILYLIDENPSLVNNIYNLILFNPYTQEIKSLDNIIEFFNKFSKELNKEYSLKITEAFCDVMIKNNKIYFLFGSRYNYILICLDLNNNKIILKETATQSTRTKDADLYSYKCWDIQNDKIYFLNDVERDNEKNIKINAIEWSYKKDVYKNFDLLMDINPKLESKP